MSVAQEQPISLSPSNVKEYHKYMLDEILKQLKNSDKNSNVILSKDDVSWLLMYEDTVNDDDLHKKRQDIVSLLFKELTPHCHNKMEIKPSDIIVQIEKIHPDIAKGYQKLIQRAWESSSTYDGAQLAITKKLSLLTLCHQLNEVFKKELLSSNPTNFQTQIKAILLAFVPPANAKLNSYQVWWNILTKKGLNLIENDSEQKLNELISINTTDEASHKPVNAPIDNKLSFFPPIIADNSTNESIKSDNLRPK